MYRNLSINTISAFQKLTVLRKFRAKRDQKSRVIKVIGENSNTISLYLTLFILRDKIKQDNY